MTTEMIINQEFYRRDPLQVARDLLGCRLVRALNGKRIAGYITETEAYDGEEDLACHARAGRTPRTAVMYGPPGHAYVYFTYGMHWLLNCVTGAEGYAAAVLVRAIYPVEGIEAIAARRPGVARARWCDGPAKLCRALEIDGQYNGMALFSASNDLWIEKGTRVPDELVSATARVGIDRVPEPWRSIPWRFVVREPHRLWTAE